MIKYLCTRTHGHGQSALRNTHTQYVHMETYPYLSVEDRRQYSILLTNVLFFVINKNKKSLLSTRVDNLSDC